ncbi:MAG TPA: hypothetical protein DCL41_10485 [Bdellovibrionales bacterium]|nr:hypothetical protein [Pseudobdellovibrionaceae bacterium]HAG92292.1 hypothetical protein [Bdellovibrionales bacterium]
MNDMRGQKGFTLIEVLIATGIFAVQILAVSVIASWAVSRFYSVRDRIITETLGYQAEVAFQSVFGQAQNIRFRGAAGNEIVLPVMPNNVGRIMHTNLVTASSANFMFDQMADAVGWQRIAAFYRESATGQGTASTAVAGRPSATFVSYMPPTANTSGVIFFDMATPVGANPNSSPSYQDLFIDRVSAFGIAKTKHPTHDQVVSIEVFLRLRYHEFGGSSGTSWCPAVDIQNNVAGCLPGGRPVLYRDIEKRFVVPLRNNLMKIEGVLASSGVSAEERTLGNLYFFRPRTP